MRLEKVDSAFTVRDAANGEPAVFLNGMPAKQIPSLLFRTGPCPDELWAEPPCPVVKPDYRIRNAEDEGDNITE